MPHRVIPAVNDRRGDFLLVGSAAFTAIGLSYVTTTTKARAAGFSWLPTDIGSGTLGWLWVLVGVFGVVSALVSKRSKRLEAAAYSALMVPPTAWAVVFFGAWVAGESPLGWVSAVSYSTMAWWILIVSGWPNPIPPTVDLPAREAPAKGVLDE